MNITGEYTFVNLRMVEDFLWRVYFYLSHRYGSRQAEIDMYPIWWYVNTGRACNDFNGKLVNSKAFMIGRTLHKGGSYEEAIDRVCEYIGFERR